ncbi:cell agglutination protein Map4, partial [Schizosaccharomyces cryophilus OY26]
SAGTVVIDTPGPTPSWVTETVTSGSKGFTSTIATPTGTSAGTVLVDIPSAWITTTTTSGSTGFTSTIATPSGTKTGTVLVDVPTPTPSVFPSCNSRCNSDNSFRIQVLNDDISPSYVHLDENNYAIASSNYTNSEHTFVYDSDSRRIVTCCDVKPVYRMDRDDKKAYSMQIYKDDDGQFQFKYSDNGVFHSLGLLTLTDGRVGVTTDLKKFKPFYSNGTEMERSENVVLRAVNY